MARGRRTDRATGPRPVTVSLADAARLLGAEGAVGLAKVSHGWDEAVGPQVAGHCRPLSLDHGVLTVVVDHPAWATELRILAGHLVERIGRLEPTVKSLAVQVGLSEGCTW
jgi:predicted nucleic acid-binding Zn ribbon protein